MTRLTIHSKNAFVRAVLDDVPFVDYNERAREMVQKFALAQLPSGVASALKAFPDWFEVSTYVNLPGILANCYVTAKDRSEFDKQLKADKKLYAELVAMEKAAVEQSNVRQALRDKVKGLVNSCTTVNALEKRAPEFKKYIANPTPEIDRSVPVVQNIVADLVKAGWPKEKAKTAK